MSQEECDAIADILEKYLMIHQLTAIIDGISEDKYKKGIKCITKAIEKLRKGKWKGIIKESMVPYVKGTVESYLKSGYAGILY